MHLNIENLTNNLEFNQKISNWINESGRG